MISILLATALAASPPVADIHRRLIPSDISMPPLRYRSTEGPMYVVFAPDPRRSCRQNAGHITLACTLGVKPSPVVTVMPDPCSFSDEAFARQMCAVDTMVGREALFRTSCQYTAQVYARLGCHEIIGHQLGRWPGDHPKH